MAVHLIVWRHDDELIIACSARQWWVAADGRAGGRAQGLEGDLIDVTTNAHETTCARCRTKAHVKCE